MSDNSLKIQSLVCSLDQFKLNTKAQLLLFEDQLKILHDVSNVETNPVPSLIPVVTFGVEQEEVVEDLHGSCDLRLKVMPLRDSRRLWLD